MSVYFILSYVLICADMPDHLTLGVYDSYSEAEQEETVILEKFGNRGGYDCYVRDIRISKESRD